MSDDLSPKARQPVPGPQFLASTRLEESRPNWGIGSRQLGGLTADDPARDGVRLGLIVFIVATTIAGVFIVGGVGQQLGLDLWLGAGSRVQSTPSTFVDGTRFPTSLLRSIYNTGVNEPLFFGLAMLVLIPPIAGLAASRPLRRGEAVRPAPVRIAGLLAVGLLIVVDIIIVIRLIGTTRPDIAECLESGAWIDTLEAVAASDGVATTLAILLAILAFRLPVDRWARVLGGTISLTTAVAAVAAAASSASIVDGVSRDFPVVRSTATGSKTLLLGPLATGGSLHLDLEPPHELHMSVENVDILEVLGRASIASTCGTED